MLEPIKFLVEFMLLSTNLIINIKYYEVTYEFSILLFLYILVIFVTVFTVLLKVLFNS